MKTSKNIGPATPNETKFIAGILQKGAVRMTVEELRNAGIILKGHETDEMMEVIVEGYIAFLDRENDKYTEMCYARSSRD